MQDTDAEPLSSHLAKWRQFAEAQLLRAGEIAARYFRSDLPVDDKGLARFDPVTAADREVEASLVAALRERFPDHGVFGEEGGDSAQSGDWQWIIDPIDGTRAFITGMPVWGILLGLLHRQRPVLGFMYQPVLDELFSGHPAGTQLRHRGTARALRTSATTELAQASLYTTHPESFASKEDAQRFAALARLCRLHRYGGDCYSYCMLAAGHVDLVVESGLAAYDILPLVPIIEGAGGVISDWQGQPLRGGGQAIAAATPALHRAALEALASTADGVGAAALGGAAD